MRDAKSAEAWVERRLPELYLLLALVLNGTMCFVTPPFFAPDEPGQSSRAISLSHGEVIASMQQDEAGANMDEGAVQAMDAMDDIRMTWEQRAGDFHDRSHGPVAEQKQLRADRIGWAGSTVSHPFGNTAVYPPLLYLPAIAGWRMGEALGLTIFWSLRLARLWCALLATSLGWLALRRGVAMRWLLLGCLLLPSTLFLNASSSQDALAMSVAALALAMVSRALTEQRQLSGWELTWATALLVMLGMARPPYVALAAVLFLPLAEQRGTRPQWLTAAGASAIVAAASAIWWYRVSALGIDTSDIADVGLQKLYLREHTVLAGIALARGTWEASMDFFHRGLYVVGWNDLLPHHGAEAVLAGCLAVLALLAPGVRLWTWRGWLLLTIAVSAPLAGISLAEYLIWTPPGGLTVFGVQPRYWLPVLPFCLLLASTLLQSRWRAVARVRAWGLLSAGLVLAVVACSLPWASAHIFYGEGLTRVLWVNTR